MRILLDSNVPRAFGALLPGHRTTTKHQWRWSDVANGPLLDADDAQTAYGPTVRARTAARYGKSARRPSSDVYMPRFE